MGRNRHDGIPGSIYSDNGGPLIIKVKGVKTHTGLPDTPENRKICVELKKKIFLTLLGIDTELTEKSRSTPFTFAEAWAIFKKKHCANKAAGTYTNYLYSYRAIVTDENSPFTKENIDKFACEFTKTQKVSEQSINIYLRGFQVFVTFCSDIEQIVDHINVRKRYSHKVTADPVKIFTDAEINKLIRYFNAPVYRVGRNLERYGKTRNPQFAKLIEFLLATGARIGEALSMERSAIKAGKMFFSNKTTNELESIPISSQITAILKKLPSDGKLFHWSETTYSKLNRTLSEAITACKIERDGRSFHEFRKTFLYHLFRSGTPVQVAKRLMRHQDIKVTMDYYTYFDDSELLESMNKASQHKPKKNTPKK